MTDWKLAMLCLVPLLHSRPQLQTWVVLFAASMATLLAPSYGLYFLIDVAAASALLRGPDMQVVIGLLFFVMAVIDLIALLYGPLPSFHSAMVVLGWAQWAVLLLWGLSSLRPFWASPRREVEYGGA